MLNSIVKPRVVLAGVVVLAVVLLLGLFIGPALAQGPWPQMPGRGWGYGGWGCDGRGGGMMMGRPPNAWGWGGNRGWGMRGRPWGYYGQQPDVQGGYTPESLPDNGDTPKSREEVSFQADIQPIFNTRCVACHGGTAGLFLDSYENVMRGGINGPAVVPRDPSNSRLVQYVSSGYMPYGGPPLTQAQAATLSNWVAAGARDN